MPSSDVDSDARTETLPPVYTGRARPVLIAEDGTRILPWIDTDVTPMAFVAPGAAPTVEWVMPRVEPPPPLRQRVAVISVLLVLGACGMLVVAVAMALATR